MRRLLSRRRRADVDGSLGCDVALGRAFGELRRQACRAPRQHGADAASADALGETRRLVGTSSRPACGGVGVRHRRACPGLLLLASSGRKSQLRRDGRRCAGADRARARRKRGRCARRFAGVWRAVIRFALAVSIVSLALIASGAEAQRPGKLRQQFKQRQALSPARPLLRRMIQAERSRSYVAREVVTREGGREHRAVGEARRRARGTPRAHPAARRGIRRRRQAALADQQEARRRGRVPKLPLDTKAAQRPFQPAGARRRDAGAGGPGHGCGPNGGHREHRALPGGDSRRFWIDRETGLRLRTEERAPDGRIRASAYYLSLDLRPNFRDGDFAPPAGLTVVKESPRRTFGVRRRSDARRASPCASLATCPSGYALRTIQESPTGDRLDPALQQRHVGSDPGAPDDTRPSAC